MSDFLLENGNSDSDTRSGCQSNPDTTDRRRFISATSFPTRCTGKIGATGKERMSGTCYCTSSGESCINVCQMGALVRCQQTTFQFVLFISTVISDEPAFSRHPFIASWNILEVTLASTST